MIEIELKNQKMVFQYVILDKKETLKGKKWRGHWARLICYTREIAGNIKFVPSV